MPLNRQIRILEKSKIFDSTGIFEVDQDGHAFSCARVEYGLQQAGKAEWREGFWYRQLCLGNHLKRIFVLEAVLVKESISLYVTESVTDVLLECPGKIRNCRRSQLAS